MIQTIQCLILFTVLFTCVLLNLGPISEVSKQNSMLFKREVSSSFGSAVPASGKQMIRNSLEGSNALVESKNTTNLPLLALQRSIMRVSELEAHEIALLQFDSRSPMIDTETYWRSSARWNDYYCKRHGHTFIYYTLPDGGKCYHTPSGTLLADPWCKVKAMLQANKDYPSVRLFIYLDSDAVVSREFEEKSLTTLISILQDKLAWDMNVKPMVFNQDGPCWWCKLVKSVGYSTCLNAGTVMWFRDEKSLRILNDWWAAAMDEQLEGNPLRRRFRLKWPWEQDRQMALYNRTPVHIQIASQPGKERMDLRAGHHDWCLSHLPTSGCFISHHCENSNSKQRLMTTYDSLREKKTLILSRDSTLFKVNLLY